MATCAFKGCERTAVEDRLFCSEHLNSYGVSGVASYKGGRDSAYDRGVDRKRKKDEDNEDLKKA